MKFFQTLKRSVYDPDLYREVAERPFSQAFVFFVKYILLLSGVVSLIGVFLVAVFLFGGKFDGVMRSVGAWYPEDLVVTIEDGFLSTNQEQPYAIPIPVEGGIRSDDRNFDYLVVFDTEYPVTMEALSAYRAIALAGERSVGFHNDNGRLEVYEIPDTANVEIDRSWIEAKIGNVGEWIQRWGILIAIFGISISVFIFLFVGGLVYLLFLALMVWFIAWMKGLSYGYRQAYILSIYLLVLPEALSVFFIWATSAIPFFRTISVGVLAVANLKKKDVDGGVKKPIKDEKKEEQEEKTITPEVVREAEIEKK